MVRTKLHHLKKGDFFRLSESITATTWVLDDYAKRRAIVHKFGEEQTRTMRGTRTVFTE